MANLPHLILPRSVYELPRKKRSGFSPPPEREYGDHGESLRGQVNSLLDVYQRRQRPQGINPSLILRVQLDSKASIDEQTWERCGLVLLSADKDKTFILFSSDSELSAFTRRLSEYQRGPVKADQATPPYNSIFAAIEKIGSVKPNDRIGRLFRLDGLEEVSDFTDTGNFSIDIELWDFGEQGVNRSKVTEMRSFITSQGGRVSDHYIGESLILLRAHCNGAIIKQLLEIESVALIDLPPKPLLNISELLNTGIYEMQPIPPSDDSMPGVAVLDSGLTSAHPLIAPAVGEATSIPQSMIDPSDGHGHGTMVAGIALYGDVEACIRSRAFIPRLKLYSARVLNERLEFDNDNLITTQMRQAIQYFRINYNCRVYNLSLGDSRLPYIGGKVSPWASILDSLSRELDIVIVVSTGNFKYQPDDGQPVDSHLTEYPRYLFSEDARIIEPATGVIVLTVGSICNSENIPPGSAGQSVAFRPIGHMNQPSPFTRSGPGLGGSVKPELCEMGGNCAYDGLLQRQRNIRELSVISMNRQYFQRLFTTDVGTSYAAPKVSYMAARLYQSFPIASANLIRALLVSSAMVPQEAIDLLLPIDSKAPLRICGYGQPNIETASTSNESRVVLYADSNIVHDNFHIYEVPIPSEFIQTKGNRLISVTLAYDPPVRHTRLDYMGVKMSFRLIRGKSIEEVIELFRKPNHDDEEEQEVEDDEENRALQSSYSCQMEPKPKYREGGTLQKGIFTMKRAPRAAYGDTYYLVVRCEKKWARAEHGPQRYAVVAVIEHTSDIDIYNRIRDRIQARVRVRT